jgi:putative endonuclease
MGGAVYIVTNKRNGTLYTGVTSNLPKRIWEHKEKTFKGFSAKYDCDKLVCYEIFSDIRDAINREKQMKEWQRKWKLRVIEELNPEWEDLYDILNQ